MRGFCEVGIVRARDNTVIAVAQELDRSLLLDPVGEREGVERLDVPIFRILLGQEIISVPNRNKKRKKQKTKQKKETP